MTTEPRRPTTGKTQELLGRLGDRAAGLSAVHAVFGVILYAVLRIAYSVFYRPFGLKPDDLGLGYLDLLVQSAVGTVLLLMAMFFAVALVVSAYVGLRPHIKVLAPEEQDQDAAGQAPVYVATPSLVAILIVWTILFFCGVIITLVQALSIVRVPGVFLLWRDFVWVIMAVAAVAAAALGAADIASGLRAVAPASGVGGSSQSRRSCS